MLLFISYAETFKSEVDKGVAFFRVGVMCMSMYLIHLKQQFITIDLRYSFTSCLLINLAVPVLR